MATTTQRLRVVATAMLAPLLAGLALMPAALAPAHAAESYVIPSSDGYGIEECMHAGVDCGRVVADGWCESHGHAHVLAFGTVEDVTGSVQASAAPQAAAAAAGDIMVRCGD